MLLLVHCMGDGRDDWVLPGGTAICTASLTPCHTGMPPGEARRRWTERLGIAPRTTYSFTLAPRDEAGGQILEDLTSRGINLVANAAAQSADHIGSYFAMLRGELAFYVSCLNLADRLAAKGIATTVPDPAPLSSPAFGCRDLRDACLKLQSQGPVIGNDVQAGGKSLVIITGANSGGKSTFLRSVGVAQLMMQCGLFVTAGSYRANVASGIFTHFIRQEDASMTSGRLDDELRRMSAIADHIGPYCLMLFNESFAGTNEREGSEIGYQVVRALLDADIKVFFVTHRFDFADRFHRQHARSTLFLRAERRPDGRRNYKLAVREPLPTSFGEDLYHQLGGWLDEDKTADRLIAAEDQGLPGCDVMRIADLHRQVVNTSAPTAARPAFSGLKPLLPARRTAKRSESAQVDDARGSQAGCLGQEKRWQSLKWQICRRWKSWIHGGGRRWR